MIESLAKTAVLLANSRELILSSHRILQRSFALKHQTLIDIDLSQLALSQIGTDHLPPWDFHGCFELPSRELEINWRLDPAA